MDGRLILGLIWLTCVRSESPNTLPIEEASMASVMSKSTSPEADESTAGLAAPLTKVKRYLSHHHSSPCPPFYPHVDAHMPMYAMRPYGPPAYPKGGYHMPMHHGLQQSPQYIHQQTYSSYAPKQTVQYIKQVAPVYNHPVAAPAIHHAPAIQPVYKAAPAIHHVQAIQPVYKAAPAIHHVQAIQPVYKAAPAIHHVQAIQSVYKVAPAIHHVQAIQPVYKAAPAIHHVQAIQPVYKAAPPVYYHDKVFAYAPAYHKPMPMVWQPQVKVEFPVHQVSYQKPAIVYKPEPPKCAPCPSAHQSQLYHQPQPSVSYVKVAQPVVHPVAQAQHYVPAAVHQPIVKPCDK